MKLAIEYLLACMGTATVAALIFFELLPDHVAVGYAAIAVTVLVIAWLSHLQIFLYQALVMLGVTAARLALHNFYNLGTSFSADVSSSIWAVMILAAGVPFGFLMRASREKAQPSANALAFLIEHPEQPLFFIPLVLMAVFLFLKMQAGMVTLAWGIEGLVVFIAALFAKERSFRLAGLGLLVLCVGKVLCWDVWRWTDKGARVLTLIAVGVILLIVPYLYGRNREAFKEYL